MEAILNKIFLHYLDQSELLKKEKEILSIKDLQKYNYKGRTISLYFNDSYFIKIDYRKNDQKKYILKDNSLLLGKFPKEIILIGILRKELPNNIVKIKNYYFNSEQQILIMENEGITLKNLIMNNLDDFNLINTKLHEIFIILAILQDKFNFMHKDFKAENILMKKTSDEFNIYNLNNKEYKIKSFGYIPVLIDFATSTIFKIYDKDFEIYDIELNIYNHNPNKFSDIINQKLFIDKYLWYIRDINHFNHSIDIYRLVLSINEVIHVDKIKIIKSYFKESNIKDYNYSESLLSPEKFLERYNNIGGSKGKTNSVKKSKTNSGTKSKTNSKRKRKNRRLLDDYDKLDIEAILKNKENSRMVILQNGLGNKLYIIANILDKYKNYQLYFVEKISHHQVKNSEKKLKYIFPEIKNSENPKIISYRNYDILKEKGIEEITYTDDIYFNNDGFINNRAYLKEYLRMDPSYNYLLTKYDFENGLFVHIRYGDKFAQNYYSLKKYKMNRFILLKPQFYIDNITKFINNKKKLNTPIYIFTDSIVIAKCQFEDIKYNFVYTNEGTYETFFCLTHCKNLIISDSTLASAAIELNENKNINAISPNFLIDKNNKITNLKYKYPSNVTLVSDKSYILDDLNEYTIIDDCNDDIDKLLNYKI